MRILILGGTGFIGRHLTELALAGGHEVSLFNRGRSGADLFPAAKLLVGDRLSDFESLKGRRWDVAFDIASYYPRMTRLSSEVLADSVDSYVLISTMALYADYSNVGNHEDSPLVKLADPTVEEVTSKTYGGLKALCEEVVHDFFPGRALIARPGVIAGPYDTTDRFTYWVKRIAAGGEVLVPDAWEQPVQLIDAKDLMSWLLRKAEEGLVGTYNLTGPESTLPFGKVLETIDETFGQRAEFIRTDLDFLVDNLDAPGNDLPLFMPFEDRRGFLQIDSTRAQREGLSYRPLRDTILDTFAWQETLPSEHAWQAGLTREREELLIQQWRSQ